MLKLEIDDFYIRYHMYIHTDNIETSYSTQTLKIRINQNSFLSIMIYHLFQNLRLKHYYKI